MDAYLAVELTLALTVASWAVVAVATLLVVHADRRRIERSGEPPITDVRRRIALWLAWVLGDAGVPGGNDRTLLRGARTQVVGGVVFVASFLALLVSLAVAGH